MGKQNNDYKAEYVDIHGKKHIVTADEAFVANGYNDPPGGYYCPYCKVPMVLCNRNGHWYFRTKPPRLDKRSQEDKDANGHRKGCKNRQTVIRKVVVEERQFSTDTENVNIAGFILRNEKSNKASAIINNMESSVTGTKRAIDPNDADISYDSKRRLINGCYDLYCASYIRGFGRSKIKTSLDSNSPRDLLTSCVLNYNNHILFRNGKLRLKGYKIAVAKKINPTDELIVSLKAKLNLSGKIWILCDPYIGEKASHVYYIFDTDENYDAGKKFRGIVGKKESSGLFLIACFWETPESSDDGVVPICVGGEELSVRCFVGHIRGRNIYELPALSSDKNIEPADFIDL